MAGEWESEGQQCRVNAEHAKTTPLDECTLSTFQPLLISHAAHKAESSSYAFWFFLSIVAWRTWTKAKPIQWIAIKVSWFYHCMDKCPKSNVKSKQAEQATLGNLSHNFSSVRIEKGYFSSMRIEASEYWEGLHVISCYIFYMLSQRPNPIPIGIFICFSSSSSFVSGFSPSLCVWNIKF